MMLFPDSIIGLIFFIAEALIIARVIVSWVPSLRYRPVGMWLVRIVDPFLRPLQRLAPPWKTGGVDLSPMIALIILWIIRSIVLRSL